jgi:hypothetical protein
MDADPAPFSAASARTERSLANLRPWTKGRSGNPKGRPPAAVDIGALARVHGPRCIEVAVELLDDPDSRIRLGALTALLDRGYGRPKQPLAADSETDASGLQLLAAHRVSDEILQRRLEPPTIDGRVATNGGKSEPLPQDRLAMLPKPTE